MTIEAEVNKWFPCFQFIRAYDARYRVCGVGLTNEYTIARPDHFRGPFLGEGPRQTEPTV